MTKAKKKASPSSSQNNPSADCPPGSRLEDCAQEATETQSIDKIRDIIFGNQMQDYEKRFARLEDGLQKKLTELQKANNKRMDSIEAFIKKEVEALSDRLKNEQSKRDTSVKKISRELKEAIRPVSKNIEALEEKQSKDSRELRQQMLDTSKDLSNDLITKQNETTQALERLFNELNEDKVGRTALSELLMELAVRTSNELAEKFNLAADDIKNE